MKLKNNKKAIVFGGSGFLGSYVADCLTENEYDVTIFDVKPSSNLKDNQKMIVGNILDFPLVKESIKDMSVIYNFAGTVDLDMAEDDPIGTIKNNILGNGYILEALKGKDIERYIFASTTYVYSSAGSFYRSSKIACEMYINDYCKKYGIPFTVLRYGSLYGPRSNQKNRIYQLVKQALIERKLAYEGNGEEVREYIHVEDVARCSVEILDKAYLNQNIILSGQSSIKIKDLMIMINEIFDKKLTIEFLNKNSELHYEKTPYSFNPRIGKKYISSHYIDLGQGIIQCAEEICNSMKKENVDQLLGKQ